MFKKEVCLKQKLHFFLHLDFFHLSCLSFKKQAWAVIAADSLCLNCIFALFQKKKKTAAAVSYRLKDYRVGLLLAP